MEKSEPTLVPEWLRNPGSITTATHFTSSSSHSDFSSLSNYTRNRISKSTSDFVDNPRVGLLDRTSSSNSRRSSTNGSAKNAYSSFSRGNRDRDRERERSSFSNHWEPDSIDPIGNILGARGERSMLQRSQSLLSRKQGDTFPRKLGRDLRNGSHSNTKNSNGVHSGGIQKAVFEKDFPSLGTEEIGRLPVSAEGWTSALAEVPNMIASSNTVSSSVQQQTSAVASSVQPASSSLNMAEALTQAPSKDRATPQLSVKTQRLEELAIKQSRQLIPVTPSITKASTLSLSDKAKPKTAVRSNEMNLTPKAVQQQPSSPLVNANNQFVGGGVLKTDPPKTKLLVLKPGRQNGVSSNHNKDVVPGPTSNANNSNRASSNQPVAAPVPSRSPKIASGERKNPISGFTVEKKPTMLQTQSRNDFFRLIKKKTSTTNASSHPASVQMEKSETLTNEVVDSWHENGVSNGGTSERLSEVGDKSTIAVVPTYPDEEEVAFLRSLGWDENSGEDEGLTEEEINAFRQQYMMKPLSKMPESHATSLGGQSTDLDLSHS